MNPEEKELLDYLYTVGQNVRDFMRMNGYEIEDGYRVVGIDVVLSPEEKHDRIYTSSSEHDGKEIRRTVSKRDDPLEDKREYKVIVGGSND